MNKAILFLEKLGTVLVDRRAQVLALVAAMIVFLPALGVPDGYAKDIEETFGAGYALVLLAIPVVTKVVSLVFMGVKLIQSWQARPPSGLAYKGLPLIRG